jgi:RNA polymerase sigma-70 factor (ECF subfamily)
MLDRRVSELLAAGDQAGAATEALRGVGADVLRYLRSVLHDEDLARDAFSDFAERLWRGLPSFEGRSSLKTWALRLAVNTASNVRGEAWRRRGRRFQTGEASALAEELRTKTFVRVERQRQALDELRALLSADDRSLLALRIDQGLSWNEVAEVLRAEGAPVEPATLMKRFERLKTRIAELARERGLIE